MYTCLRNPDNTSQLATVKNSQAVLYLQNLPFGAFAPLAPYFNLDFIFYFIVISSKATPALLGWSGQDDRWLEGRWRNA